MIYILTGLSIVWLGFGVKMLITFSSRADNVLDYYRWFRDRRGKEFSNTDFDDLPILLKIGLWVTVLILWPCIFYILKNTKENAKEYVDGLEDFLAFDEATLSELIVTVYWDNVPVTAKITVDAHRIIKDARTKDEKISFTNYARKCWEEPTRTLVAERFINHKDNEIHIKIIRKYFLDTGISYEKTVKVFIEKNTLFNTKKLKIVEPDNNMSHKVIQLFRKDS